MATDTAELPTVGARSGTYQLRQDRCVVEIAYRLLGQPLWRRRLPAESGALTIGNESTLDMKLCWLDGTVEFDGLPTPDLTSVSGTVRIADEARELTMRLRRLPTDQQTILLAGHGVLRLRRPLRIEIAAEFTR